MSDLQKTFDIVAKHLLKQGKKALSRYGSCAYRIGNLRCAVGVLIPDGMYESGMEGRSVHGLLERFPELTSVPTINGFGSHLQALQGIHDDCNVDEWPEQLRKFAKRYRLNHDVVDRLAGGSQ